MSASSLLRPLAAASAVLALGLAPPALAASSTPATAGPDPSPSAPSPSPDPYPAAATRPVVVPRPVPSTPIAHAATPIAHAAPRRRTPPVQHAVRGAHHTVTKHVSPPPARSRRPDPPAPSLGDRVFGAVSRAPRVPTGAALAVALVVLLSGLFLARAAREMAR